MGYEQDLKASPSSNAKGNVKATSDDKDDEDYFADEGETKFDPED